MAHTMAGTGYNSAHPRRSHSVRRRPKSNDTTMESPKHEITNQQTNGAHQTNTMKALIILTLWATLNTRPVPTPFSPAPRTGPRQLFTVRLSHYWPPLGGTNCHPAHWQEPTQGNPGQCNATLAGEPWSTWVKIGAACPPEIPLTTLIYIIELKKAFYCIDRGGAVQTLPDKTLFIDILKPDANYIHKGNIIKDKYCPSGCYTSKAYLLP